MREFWVLFKHEFKMQFNTRQKGKFDFIGSLLSLLTTLLVGVVFVVLVSTIVENYVALEMNKVSAPLERSHELLNVFYTVLILTMSFVCMEKMRGTLTRKKDRDIFLRLPVKHQTLFMSKLCTLMIWNYLFALLLIVPVNLIFYLVLKPTIMFWGYTLVVWLLMPMTAFLIATVFLVPYIKIIDFVSNKYWLIFLILSAIVIGAFLLYSGLLSILQSLMETGSIKFLFNAQFVRDLQSLLTWTYPANSFASIVLGQNLTQSLLIVLPLTLLSVVLVYFVSKGLFHATMFKNEAKRKTGKVKTSYRTHFRLTALLRKEFITVFRDPQHLFSYFSIATAMPVMVYSCYTLFESLIINAIGMKITFSLALLVLLIFSILTNTFCATNITRDGLTALKAKMFPVRATKLLFAKVLFCAIVSSLAIIVSVIVLSIATALTQTEAILCAVIALLFSMAQIFLATRMDLNHAKVSGSPAEIEKISNRTVSKVVVFGLVLALAFGIGSLLISIFAGIPEMSNVLGFALRAEDTYLLPLFGSIGYLVIALLYYSIRIKKSFERLIA